MENAEQVSFVKCDLSNSVLNYLKSCFSLKLDSIRFYDDTEIQPFETLYYLSISNYCNLDLAQPDIFPNLEEVYLKNTQMNPFGPNPIRNPTNLTRILMDFDTAVTDIKEIVKLSDQFDGVPNVQIRSKLKKTTLKAIKG